MSNVQTVHCVEDYYFASFPKFFAIVLNDVFRLIDSGKNTKICLFCNLRSMHITLLLDFFFFLSGL